MMPCNTHNQSGFSLVETLVAITILLIVITGPLTLVSNSARSTDFANDQVMANFLAQEGVELVQSKRDDLLIPKFAVPAPGGDAWDDFIGNPVLGACFTTSGCGLDVTTNFAGAVVAYNCSGTNACRLFFNNNLDERSAYTYVDTGNPSKYTRVITMEETSTGQVEVISTVTWRSDGQRAVQEVQTVTYLFDVYDR